MTARERAAITAMLARQTTDDLGRRLASERSYEVRDLIIDTLSRRYAQGPRWVGAPAKDLTRW